MQPILPYLRESKAADRPWLILGKGPSFSRHSSLDLSKYLVLGLNHVPLARPVDMTHVCDIDVFAEAGKAILANGGLVVVPYYPHIRYAPREEYPLPNCLGAETNTGPILSELDKQGRLFYYKSSQSVRFVHPPDAGTMIRVRHFSAVAAVNLLATAGVKEIRTLGVDGGTEYAPEFSMLTPLANGRSSFDAQKSELKRAVERGGGHSHKHRIDLSAL